MKVVEYQKLLGVMYREDYQNDPLIAKTLIESGWAVKRLLENKTISPFDEYEKVQELIILIINHVPIRVIKKLG